jgi:lipoprotein-anchoring transpeptidase ErfK/SrfK
MRRQVLLGLGVGAAAVVVIGSLVWVSQQGLFGPYGKAKRLLSLAKHAVANEQLPAAQAHLEELIGTFPSSPWTDDALLELGKVYEAQQLYVEARGMYNLLLQQFPSSGLVTETQTRLGEVNVSLLFSPVITDLDVIHEVRPGDTLGKIAAAYHTTVDFIKQANGLKSDIIRPHQKLKVPGGRFGILVDKSQNQLLLTEDQQFIKTYPVATGKENSTPVGTFKIVNKITDPVWYTQGAVVPQDSPENILGTRWMGISKQGYGIHGSVDPASIGQQVTAGCVRMTNADVEELFTIIPIGTEVTIVD